MFIKIICAFCILTFTLISSSCGSKESGAQNEEKSTIVVTTTQLKDLVSKITKSRFNIISLMKPGIDPHTYKPTSRDILALTKADLVIYHGMMLEGRLSELLEKAEQQGIQTYNATSSLKSPRIIFHGDIKNNSQPDPHVWFDPEIWTTVAENFTKMICLFDPEGKSGYINNLLSFTREIEGVQKWTIKKISTIPTSKRTLVTSHDAYSYFGRSFGLEVVALQGISTLLESGLGDRAKVVDLIKEQNIPAVFIESSVNPKALNEIAKECGVSVGGELFSDALGTEATLSVGPEGNSYTANTWTGMMVHNVNTIVNSLSK